MKEQDIRPEELYRENTKLHGGDVEGILFQKGKFEKINCPACEANRFQTIFEKDGFTFVSCTDCETIFVNPRPSYEMLRRYNILSKSMKHWNDQVFPASQNYRKHNIFIPRAQKIVALCKNYNVDPSVLIDVGAGFGDFCRVIKKLDFFAKVIAIEPSPDRANACRKYGVDVIEKQVEDCKLEQVSVVTNFELIEHLYWPKDFILSIAQLLPVGGIFIFTTPNIKGFDLLTLGELSNTVVAPQHINYFHPKSLSHLLKNCGFEIVEILTPGKLDAELVRKKILNGEFDVSGQPFLKQILVSQWESTGEVFQNFLAENCLSSHMWVVARKCE